jgi:hypothetical protein
MKKVFNIFLTSCWVRIYHLWMFLVNFWKYYLKNPKFFLVDSCIFFQYFFKNPYGLIRRYDEAHPEEEPLGPYGETEFPVIEEILNRFHIPKSASFLDFGSGRGRMCFWLKIMRGQKKVTGVEKFVPFLEKAKKIKNLFSVDGVTFTDTFDIESHDVVYMYGSSWLDETVLKIAEKAAKLPKGTIIITTSYWLGDYLPDHFLLEDSFEVRFIWGKGSVYKQTVI